MKRVLSNLRASGKLTEGTVSGVGCSCLGVQHGGGELDNAYFFVFVLLVLLGIMGLRAFEN